MRTAAPTALLTTLSKYFFILKSGRSFPSIYLGLKSQTAFSNKTYVFFFELALIFLFYQLLHFFWRWTSWFFFSQTKVTTVLVIPVILGLLTQRMDSQEKEDIFLLFFHILLMCFFNVFSETQSGPIASAQSNSEHFLTGNINVDCEWAFAKSSMFFCLRNIKVISQTKPIAVKRGNSTRIPSERDHCW